MRRAILVAVTNKYHLCKKLLINNWSKQLKYINFFNQKKAKSKIIMSPIGILPQYQTGFSDWEVYIERLEQFFDVNNIDGDKKKALLLTSIDEEVYKTLRDVCHPTPPKSKTYIQLLEILNKQFVIRKTIYRERIAFYKSYQESFESIAMWFARIKKLSVGCKFGDQFDNILKDRFISGMYSPAIVDCLCEEDENLTLQPAVDKATMKESSNNNTNIQPSPNQYNAPMSVPPPTAARRAYKRKAPQDN